MAQELPSDRPVTVVIEGLEKIGQFDDLFFVINAYLADSRGLQIIVNGRLVEVFTRRPRQPVHRTSTITQAVAWALEQPMVAQGASDE